MKQIEVINFIGLNISIFNKKKQFLIYVYSNFNYTYLNINKKLKLKIKNDKSVTIEKEILYYYNINTTTDIKLKINYFLNQIKYYIGVKIKFAGKGYKIKKKTKNSILFLFNRSHITTLWYKNIKIKKLKKYKLYLIYTNIYNNITNTLIKIRKINIFTKKGLRKSRQTLIKKKGEKIDKIKKIIKNKYLKIL